MFVNPEPNKINKIELLSKRYSDSIRGQISCFDRIILTGTLPQVSHAQAMEIQMHLRKRKLKDYGDFVSQTASKLRKDVELLARQQGLKVDYLLKNIRKEERIKEVLQKRGMQPGIVHIFSAQEKCFCFKVKSDYQRGYPRLYYTGGKCLHYYIYFIDEDLGLCFFRIPTWAPFKITFYMNGHNYLASQLDKAQIGYKMLDNAFTQCEDWSKAQQLADNLSTKQLHESLDRTIERFIPALLKEFVEGVRWSVSQVEYASDIIFKEPELLQPLYDNLIRESVCSVKADDVAGFLGRKLDPRYRGEVDTLFNTRIEGRRIRHSYGRCSVKMYDKFGFILRVETTSNDIKMFKDYREVNHRNGTTSFQIKPLKKSVHSLRNLQHLMAACNRRYLQYLSDLEDSSRAQLNLEKLSARVKDKKKRSWKGFNLFDKRDFKIILAVAQAIHSINGVTNKMLRSHLPWMSSNQISRTLRRLRNHGIIKKIANTCKYYATKLGQKTILTALHLKARVVVPNMA